MTQHNILLVVIDCLRYDRVTEKYMPFLTEFGRQNTSFTNFWSVSHCTDPAMTALLSGKWPDELHLYSMMYETDYDIPQDVEMLAQTAKRHGYSTATISNLVRWYTRGVDRYVDNRDWHGADTFSRARQMIKTLQQPWLLVVHDDSCHTNYRGGSYDTACAEVDTDLCHLFSLIIEDELLVDNTFIFVTSDHGEALGQYGIEQHGHGLWPVLTHVPLIMYWPFAKGTPYGSPPHEIPSIVQHTHMHGFISEITRGTINYTYVYDTQYAHIVGRMCDTWHRAVTDGKIMVIKEQDVDSGQRTWIICDNQDESYRQVEMGVAVQFAGCMWEQARQHAAQFGIDADHGNLDDDILERRLRSLGYFD